ncbi:ras-related and estrogen-regulated growth inhibitor-like protein isoform X1 [Euwallacea fornicatus]|uniref:ras-related and estrogen-regulated growth inhibitor-like protein isoform X1 n=2 Tax=Euwallacea fornicatus TaxID=995702 RepID=UPI00338E5A8E
MTLTLQRWKWVSKKMVLPALSLKKMKTEDKNNIPKVRIAVIGKSNVGKSALTVRYLTRRYIGEYRSNTDLLYRQTLTINNTSLEVEIVDVCSCDLEAFPEEAIYWADAAVVVYDVTCRTSFSQASEMLQKVLQLRPQIPTVLLGNKADLEHLRKVEETEGRTVGIQNNCTFYEVSVADNSQEIYQAFDMVLNECRQSTQKTRKFSVSKMIGSLIGNVNPKPHSDTKQGGTVVVCHKSDLYKSRVLRRRQNFTATASL